MKCFVWIFRPLPERFKYSCLFSNRSLFGKLWSDKNYLLGSDGNCQSFPATGASSFNDQPAVFTGHPDEKTMGPFT